MLKYFTIIGAIAIGAMGMWFFGAKPTKEPPPQPPLMSLQSMGHLASVRVNYANVIEFTERITQGIPWTQWELRFGGTRVLLVARGDCLVGTDLRLAEYEETNEAARTTVLVLPAPSPISARVSHDSREKGGSYFYAIDATGLEPLMPGSSNRSKAIESALRKAQQEVELACRSVDVATTAKKNTEEVLKPAFQAIGWKVQIRWR
jgi:hypothetical protein